VKTQKTGNVRGKGTQEGVWKNRSDPVVQTAAPFGIWGTIKKFHPNKMEILNVVRVLNKMGAKRTIIAAALNLQEWNNFLGVYEWTIKDVKEILEGFRT
jgi:hypothetical protein